MLGQTDFRTTARKKSILMGTCCSLITLYATSPALSANWTIEPSVELSTTYTDNAGLGSRSDDDFLVTGRANAIVTANTQSIEASINGGVAYDKYIDSNRLDGVRINLLGITRFNVVQDKFSVDARASIQERNNFRSSPTPARDRTVDEDGSRTYSYSVTPTFRQQIANGLEAFVSATASGTSYGDRDVGSNLSGIRDRNSVRVDAAVGTPLDKPGFTWNISGYYLEDDRDFDRTTVQAQAGFPLSSKITPFVIVGHDDINNARIDEDRRSGEFYFGGVTLTPGPRLSLQVAIGERFGDTSGSANLNYQFSETLSLQAVYTEDVLTQQQTLDNALRSLGQNPDGFIIDEVGNLPDALIEFLLDNREVVFKEERFRVGLNGDIGRNTIGVSFHHVQRTFDDTQQEEELIGVALDFSRQLSNRVDFYGRISYDDDLKTRFGVDENENLSGYIGASIDLSSTLSASAEYGYTNHKRDMTSDITENAFTLSLRKTF